MDREEGEWGMKRGGGERMREEAGTGERRGRGGRMRWEGQVSQSSLPVPYNPTLFTLFQVPF